MNSHSLSHPIVNGEAVAFGANEMSKKKHEMNDVDE